MLLHEPLFSLVALMGVGCSAKPPSIRVAATGVHSSHAFVALALDNDNLILRHAGPSVLGRVTTKVLTLC